MGDKINPCQFCGFAWKDYCSSERRQECIELYRQKKEQFEQKEGGKENEYRGAKTKAAATAKI